LSPICLDKKRGGRKRKEGRWIPGLLEGEKISQKHGGDYAKGQGILLPEWERTNRCYLWCCRGGKERSYAKKKMKGSFSQHI